MGCKLVLFPNDITECQRAFSCWKTRWLNQKAFRSTFNHALSFLRNYVPWVPGSGDETVGQTKHFPSHAHNMHFGNWFYVCSLTDGSGLYPSEMFRNRLGKSLRTYILGNLIFFKKSQNHDIRNYYFENAL